MALRWTSVPASSACCWRTCAGGAAGRRHRPAARGPVGRGRSRQGERAVGLRLPASLDPGAGPQGRRCAHGLRHQRPRLRTGRRSRRGGRPSVRTRRGSGDGAPARGPGRGLATADRGVGRVARRRARGVRVRGLRAAGDRPAHRAASRRDWRIGSVPTCSWAPPASWSANSRPCTHSTRCGSGSSAN